MPIYLNIVSYFQIIVKRTNELSAKPGSKSVEVFARIFSTLYYVELGLCCEPKPCVTSELKNSIRTHKKVLSDSLVRRLRKTAQITIEELPTLERSMS